MANQMSDDMLRKALQNYGEVVGPITATTRSVQEKRLMNLRKRHRGRVSELRSCDAFSLGESGIGTTLPQSQKTENVESLFHRSQHGEVDLRSSGGPSSVFDVNREGLYYSHGEMSNLRRKARSLIPPAEYPRVDLNRHSDGINRGIRLQRQPAGFAYWNPNNNSQYLPNHSQSEDSITVDGDDVLRREVATNESASSVLMTFMNKVWTSFLCFGLCQYLVIIPALLSPILDHVVIQTIHPDREYYEVIKRYVAIAWVTVTLIVGILQYRTMRELQESLQKAEIYERSHLTESAEFEIAGTADHRNDDNIYYYYYE